MKDTEAREAVDDLCLIVAEAISYADGVATNDLVYIGLMDRIRTVQDALRRDQESSAMRPEDV